MLIIKGQLHSCSRARARSSHPEQQVERVQQAAQTPHRVLASHPDRSSSACRSSEPGAPWQHARCTHTARSAQELRVLRAWNPHSVPARPGPLGDQQQVVLTAHAPNRSPLSAHLQTVTGYTNTHTHTQLRQSAA